MEMPNTIIVCDMISGGGFTNCHKCPLLKECESTPKDPDHPADWEERMEKAAIEYLSGAKMKGGAE